MKHLFEFDWYMRLNENAKRVFVLAQEECTRMGGHERIGTSQLPLGLICEGDGVGCRVLITLGVDLAELQKEIVLESQFNSEKVS